MIEGNSKIEQKQLEEILSLRFVYRDYPLAPHTYYNIGGCADIAMIPINEEEMALAYRYFQEFSLPRFILGGGTNVLISDKGFRGLVLITCAYQQIQSLGGDRYYITSGVELQRIVKEIMLENNYEGVGALTGIPGTVGGALFMNAGTVNGCICEWAEEVHLLSSGGLRMVSMCPSLYSYRSQKFCSTEDLILGAVFHFRESDKDQRPIYEHYISRRKEKQPEGHCCGSVFKNPPNEHAGKLIEDCGLKGYRYGGAVISPVHANFIMNEGNASFNDVLYLIRLAKHKVLEKFNICLEEEVRIIFEDGCFQYCPHQTIKNEG
ncbi:MAG: UDP-N-acetylmuramate dehydrogenase [Candidatus Hydrogenedens sp.]|nr:UDP-N-acetylmuramate dehydrogenase [Candidatus Hydrogenedens sp.]